MFDPLQYASQTLNLAESLIQVSILFDFSLASGEEEKRIRTRIQTLMILLIFKQQSRQIDFDYCKTIYESRRNKINELRNDLKT